MITLEKIEFLFFDILHIISLVSICTFILAPGPNTTWVFSPYHHGQDISKAVIGICTMDPYPYFLDST